MSSAPGHRLQLALATSLPLPLSSSFSFSSVPSLIFTSLRRSWEMSSNIPVRRTRVTRTTATQKDNENATRLTRLQAAAKPSHSAAATSHGGPLTRAMAPTAASRAKAGGGSTDIIKPDMAATKRKREALGEVPKGSTTAAANGKKGAAAVTTATKGRKKEALAPVQLPSKATSGKSKEVFDGVVVKPSKAAVTTTTTTTTTTAASRPTTRTTTRRVVERTTVIKVPKDEPVAAKAEVKTVVHQDQPERQRVTRSSSRSVKGNVAAIVRAHRQVQEEIEEGQPVFKKMRTSSDAVEPEPQPEPVLEPVVEEEDAPAEDVAPIDDEVVRLFEADPDGPDWVDLDKEDTDDPVMVSEYVVEIFNYLREVEQTTMPNPHYIDKQSELSWPMRGLLIDWLVQLHAKFRLLPETLFLCVNLVDRFLSARVVSLAKVHLVGITCLFIASKVEEIVSPSIETFIHYTGSQYEQSEVLKAERYVLMILDWNLSYPNPMNFLRRISKADEYDITVRTVAKYFLEVGCLEWRLLAAPPSLLAAAAMWLSRIMLGREEWTPNLAHYSGYSESSIIPTANFMLNYVLKRPDPEAYFPKKYAGKKYMKTSVFVEQWTRERWPEGTKVNLAEDLPALKEAIRVAREEAEQEQEA